LGDRASLDELDGDVARALADPGDSATGAGAPALQRRPLVGVGSDHDELVARPVEIGARLGVRDGRAQHLLDVRRDRTAREGENRTRLRNGASTDEVGDEPRLPRARMHPARLSAHGLPLFHDSRHQRLTFAARSPAWPRNVLVGANSPSLCPTICSEMKTGTCLRPSWTAIVWPTISGKIVEARDQVRIMFFWPDSFIASIRLISRS